jgi:arylsulfatase A-like enzyme
MDIHAPYRAAEQYIEPRLAAVARTPDKHILPENAYGLPPLCDAYRDDPRHEQLKNYAEYWQACYDAGVPQVDEHLGVLRAGLRGLHLWDEAWIVFVSDHGEALGEHVGWGHGDALYQTELHVPLVLRWPGHFAAGTRITRAVSLVDLLPTMLELLQLPVPQQVQGHSLCGLIRGEAAAPTTLIVEGVKRRPEVQALVRWPWKLISFGDEQRVELYNLADDWAETKDLAAAHSDLVAELQATLAAQATRNQLLAKGVRSERVPLSAEDLERLRALGYVLDEQTQPAAVSRRRAYSTFSDSR